MSGLTEMAETTTYFLLIRHGATNSIGRFISGRRPGFDLNAEGEIQAKQLAAELGRLQISALYASPMERTRQTAEIIGNALKISPVMDDSIAEINYGEWTCRDFAELDKIPAWRLYNTFRSHGRIPGGEMLLEVQARIVAEMLRLEEKHRGGSVALVSHSDVIRSAIGYYAGIPIDLVHRLEVALASTSVLAMGEYDVRVVCVNAVGPLITFAPARQTGAASAMEAQRAPAD